MISDKTFQFLKELSENNNRPWFQANKSRYEEARANFEAFISELILEISRFDPPIRELEARKSIFRIYRDTRFSKDKKPYKTNLGAHLVSADAKPHDRAGYYIHLQPGNTFLAGGAYLPPAPWLKAIRNAIDQKGKEFVKIINHPDFKKHFGEMEGEQLKTTPRDYDADHPFIDLLRYKSFLAVHKLNDEATMSGNFLKTAGKVFKALKPFDDFLNKSLDHI
jgi:uncharacterized protein (TIGR02453 family)